MAIKLLRAILAFKIIQRAEKVLGGSGTEHQFFCGPYHDSCAGMMTRVRLESTSPHRAREAGREIGRESSRDHRTQAEPRELDAPVGREDADAADLDADRGEICETQ